MLRNIVIRQAKKSDLLKLYELETKCWPSHLQSSTIQIQDRINQFPAGQFVILESKKVVGVLYTQRISNIKALNEITFKNVLTIHDIKGPFLQFLAINIDPAFQDRGFGDKLLQHAFHYAKTHKIKKIVAVTRCLNYVDHKDLSVKEYIDLHLKTERGIDPILRFHTSHGANILGILPNYRSEDVDNQGAGILIEYELGKVKKNSNSLDETKDEIFSEKIILDSVKELLLDSYQSQFAYNLPLRELGFDSLKLLELKLLLEKKLGVKLDPTFFFNKGSVEEIIQYFNPKQKKIVKQQSINQSSEPIAIIGMACRFPGGADDTNSYWQLLNEGRDAVTTLSEQRKKLHSWGEGASQFGGFLDNIDTFDPLFFNISPREAELMDPQQRILLQTTWEAFENAGIAAHAISGTKTGVFVGHFIHDYETILSKSLNRDEIDSYFVTGNSASVAAGRISYAFGLQGPATAINTACSSSLVAIHLACQSLKHGESAIAVAGGVNLILSSELTIAFSKAGMLAPDGKCKTFDETADGYVRSEGCGIVILKRLSDAIKDHDNILAVIKGSAVNQDGASNGLTAPNQQAQIDLMRDALNNAELSPEDIQYFEAHGTGTALGDPIEVKAIEEVYKKRTSPLYLGSVKTNLGHLEAAAGVAGLIKIVLAMQNKKIPPHLHFTKLNSLIKLDLFKGVIPTTEVVWKDVTQRAVISSFGSSGTNAHMVLESPPNHAEQTIYKAPAYLITFSAKTNNALKQNIINFYNWLQRNDNQEISEISYTLNVGRCHFSKRVAVVVDSISELKQSLNRIINGEQSPDLMQVNEISIKENVEHIINELKKITNKEQYKKNMLKLANVYMNGKLNDFSLLYVPHVINKIQLPAYAFAKDRYWIPVAEIKYEGHGLKAALHPMLDANISTITEICFSKIFSANEFYLKDHVVDNKIVLPGVVYLEMARMAAALAEPEQHVKGFSHVVWMRPLFLENRNSTLSARVQLYLTNNDLEFELVSEDKEETIVHAQGKVHLSTAVSSAQSVLLDIESIKHRSASFSRETIYQNFAERGLQYGSSFQVIQTLWVNEQEALGKLQLPSSQALDKFVLHPSLLDAALQTVMGLKGQTDKILYLPFSLGRVDILKPMTENMYAYAKEASKKDTYTIQLIDDQGRVAVVLDNFIIRSLKQPSVVQNEVHYFQPAWEKKISLPQALENGSLFFISNDLSQDIIEKLKSKIKGQAQLFSTHDMSYIEQMAQVSLPRYIVFQINGIAGLKETFHIVFDVIQRLLKQKPKHRIDCVFSYDNQKELKYYSEGLSGFWKTVNQESPCIHGKILGVSEDLRQRTDHYCDLLLETLAQDDMVVQYRNQERYVQCYEPLSHESVKGSSIYFKSHGVYLITGGAGGLGLIIAEHLAKKYQAKFVLIGRSELKASQFEKINAIKLLGSEVIYERADITCKEDVEKIVYKARTHFGVINGIIHSAGIIKDSFIIKKTATEFTEVLSPKIAGTINLDELTKSDRLDFFVLFSSITSVIGNIGQSDYTYANAFMDAYAEAREILREQGKRFGKTIAINWPLWQDGGMQIEESLVKIMEERTGFKPLSKEQGLRGLELALDCKKSQIIVAPGNQKNINLYLNRKRKEIQNSIKTSSDNRIETVVTEIISNVLKIKSAEIDGDTPLEEYGIDSIMMMNILDSLEKEYQIPISADSLINFPTIRSLAKFLENQGARSQPKLSLDHKIKNKRIVTRKNTIKKIAIIGMAGRFPGSPNLESYWDNLLNGRDLITEIPEEKWKVADHFSSDKSQPNKSYSKWGGFIKDIEWFDASHFNATPDDAIMMDPSQRLLLELTQELLDRSGYKKEEIDGRKVGVFIGSTTSGYHQVYRPQIKSEWLKHFIVNHIQNMQAARIADFYNLSGPAYTIDTACSSSLVAIHQACQSILSGESEFGIVGGIELLLGEEQFVYFSKANVLSDDGKCHVFDEKANGMVLGEGLGLILLKEYEQAVADGDNIQAVILGSAINNDGHTPGLTVPNQKAQKEVIEAALRKTEINPNTIKYYEAHGTGTLLGDPIEIKAMTEVYEQYQVAKGHCAVGSVKTNIGHLLRAAGIASVIKVVLAMQHKMIPPSIHCENPHPRFNFKNSPFYPATKSIEWNDGEVARRAAISSFGFGGTNCHMILEEGMSGGSLRKPLPMTQFKREYYWLGEKNNNMQRVVTEKYKYNEMYLKDHLVSDNQVLLGVTHCSLAVTAIRKLLNTDQAIKLTKVYFEEAIQIKENEEVKVLVETRQSGNKCLFKNYFQKNNQIEEKISCSGEYEITSAIRETIDVTAIKSQSNKMFASHEIYNKAKQIYHGKSLQTVKTIFVTDDIALGELELTEAMKSDSHHYTIHPAFLDAAWVVGFSLMKDIGQAYLPFMIKELSVFSPLSEKCYCYATIDKSNAEIITFTLKLCDSNGNVLVVMKEAVCKRLRNSLSSNVVNDEKKLIPPHAKRSMLSVENEGNIQAAIKKLLIEKLQPMLPAGREIDIKQNIMDMGVDSNKLVLLTRTIENEAKIELYPTLLFEYQNITDLSQFFAKEYSKEFSELLNIGQSTVVAHEMPLQVQPQILPPMSNTIAEKHFDSVNAMGQASDEDIAVIGMSGIFPGSPDTATFWQHLQNKTDLMKEIPMDHWDYRPWFDDNMEAENKIYCKWGSFIDDVDKFDASFFRISPREAEMMDPQLRKLLQVFYSTVEDAGIINKFEGSETGVYVGCCFHDYQKALNDLDIVTPYDGTGNASTMLANRPSFFFNLKGPSLAVDTACSSSLVALHLACQALKKQECEMALVGGTNLLLHSWHYRYFCSIGALSPSGRCHSFDSRADGYTPGEAVAAVLLKPLKKALQDNDQIHAIIKGSAINHGGYTPSVTAPSVKQEADVILKAWKNANIDPNTISYIEAHGTGTKLGDPVEVKAILNAFETSGITEKNICALGSVKSNIGHTEGAAGIVGLIKVILSMKNKQFPAMPNFQELNPMIDLSKGPLYINQEHTEWKTQLDAPRRAGVSSFGFGGAYAHVVMEEWIYHRKEKNNSKPYYLFTLSAKTEDALKQKINDLYNSLCNISIDVSLENISYTLNVGRARFANRMAIVAKDLNELKDTLKIIVEGKQPSNCLQKLDNKKMQEEPIFLEILNKILDEISSQIYDEMTYKNKLLSLADLFIKGYEINWNKLHENESKQRISLPSYPFAKERYWVEPSSRVNPSNQVELVKQTNDFEFVSHVRFCQGLEKAWELSSTLRNEEKITGRLIVLVTSENYFIAKNVFEKLPSIQPMYVVLEELNAKDIAIDSSIIGVLDFSDVGNVYHHTNRLKKLEFLQSLVREKMSHESNIRILNFTYGLQPFKGKCNTLSGAGMVGLMGALSAEYGKLDARTIDLDFDIRLENIDRLIDVLTREWNAEKESVEICYREGKRYVPALRAVFNEANMSKDVPLLKNLSATKAYVITGGTGGIGLEVAHYLVRSGAKNLVLMGMQKLPPKEEWKTLLQSNVVSFDASTLKKIKNILAIEEMGVKVSLYFGQLNDVAGLKESFNQVRKSVGAVGGIVHCAGLVDKKTPAFIKKSIEDIQRVIEPKITGLLNLHEIFKEEKLDFFLLFSSISSQIPLAGAAFADYAMANSFMDYFAHYQSSKGYAYQAIQWGNWKEVGFGESKSAPLSEMGLLPHLTSEGLYLLEKIVSNPSYINILACVTDATQFKNEELLKVKRKTMAAAQNREVSSPSASVSKADSVLPLLKKIFSEELKLPEAKLDANISFGDFGVDSILLAELVQRLERQFKVNLDPSILIEHSTLNALSHYLEKRGVDVKETKQPARVIEASPIQMIAKEPLKNNRIAVIGMACHFPGAPNKEIFWKNLTEGKSSICEIPELRWNINDWYDAEGRDKKSISKWGGFIEGIEYFDPEYFGLSEIEVLHMDPLERQLLETSVQLMCDAGYKKEELWGKKVGVFVGARSSSYASRIKDYAKSTIIGIGQNFIATNVSHIFNFKGPSLVIDTACSSSLVGIHMACQSLLTGESEVALAGGVDILLDETPYLILSEAKALSSDGKCHTFDEKASGFVPGEGCGLVLLKPLEKAIADGDQIYGVIEGTAVNNDGHTMGITTPNPQAQQQVIEEALMKTNVSAGSIGYIEAHGTGTMIGDPIELTALTNVFRRHTHRNKYCAIGSVKTNLGHLLSAAGVASFIKVMLQLYHKQIVPTLNCTKPNPRFDFEHSPFYPNVALQEWKSQGTPLRAGMSSFGFGGTNAHCVVSEFCETAGQKNRISLPLVTFKSKKIWLAKNEISKGIEPNKYFQVDSFSKSMDRYFEYEMEEISEI